MTSTQLFDQMPTDLGMEIIDYTHATEKALYKAMLDTVAQARKVRPVFLERQPRLDRNLTLLQSLARPALSTAADSLLCFLSSHARNRLSAAVLSAGRARLCRIVRLRSRRGWRSRKTGRTFRACATVSSMAL